LPVIGRRFGQQQTESPAERLGFSAFEGTSLNSDRIEQARSLVTKGRYLEAIPLLRDILQQAPTNAPAHFWMANSIYLTGGSAEEALSHYDAAQAAGHPLAEVSLYRGIALAEAGRYAEAHDCFWEATDAPDASAHARLCKEQTARILGGSVTPADYYYAPPHVPHLTSQWLEEASIPQSQQFMIDCLPSLRGIFSRVPKQEIELLDVGTASGGGANVIASLYSGSILGRTIRVEAIDLIRRYQEYARRAFPRLRYICGDLFQVDPTQRWDVTVCSHTIEHMEDPTPLIRHCQDRARHFALFYAPFEEVQLIPGHLRSIQRDYVESLGPLWWEVGASPGWQHPHDAVSRTVMFVLPGRG
ncbi:MAG: methyltransferase domain-containing protein, partial [Bryobacterales bacterium]|nr:methyltransferase domain-containing protein [Bryobacterales bacterium]